MKANQKREIDLWKVVWVFGPLTYVLAIALFALSGLALDHFGGKTTVIVGGQAVESVTAQWVRYAWYQSAFVQVIALAHAALFFFMVLRFMRNTQRLWFKIFAVALASIYIAYAAYLTFRFFHTDPSLQPIVDHF
ncbi:hypothetical protein [Luteimonas cucumeris]|uniref:hypothetical protein n=1 Tax=Luteimonas cucumeris TaxID=985012 RepID=UPI0011A92230|nr:hypothetical protein [Luteimonas cucumeris]